MSGKEVTIDDIIRMSERVYNFQRVFNLRMGKGTREWDRGPYRAMGPVTVEEYESRAERYDKQLQETVGFDPQGKSTPEKMAALRTYREQQYEGLLDAVYKRRGWNNNGVPTLETLRSLGIDYPWVVEVVTPHLK
jgi:aldehyde:ferredoxin oxidoreductase